MTDGDGEGMSLRIPTRPKATGRRTEALDDRRRVAASGQLAADPLKGAAGRPAGEDEAADDPEADDRGHEDRDDDAELGYRLTEAAADHSFVPALTEIVRVIGVETPIASTMSRNRMTTVGRL